MRLTIAMAVAAGLAACSWLGKAAPVWVTARPSLPACGEEGTRYGESRNVAARQCLFDAYQQGRTGELIVTETTVEGDPITRIIRVLGTKGVEVFADATHDRYGSGRWEAYRCSGLESVAANNSIPDNRVPAEMVFVEEGCQPFTPT